MSNRKGNSKSKSALSTVITVLIIVIVIITYFNERKEVNNATVTTDPISDGVTVSYIDVGQGDSSFIQLPDGTTMLIDAGEASSEGTYNFLKNNGYKKIDYVVCTHMHTDHMGGMEDIIDDFEIGKIYMPKGTNSKSSTYKKLLECISDNNYKITAAKAGDTIIDADGVLCSVLAPKETSYEEENDYSIVIKLTYKSSSFLFMGDAETLSEGEILDAGYDVSADIIKIGHHGSNSSSSAAFVNAVNPGYAVICVGEGNDYGHPKDKVVKRWESAGAEILRTDLNGTITISTDGEVYNVTTEK